MKNSKVSIFIDDAPEPIAVSDAPVQLELDTKKLIDGNHVMKIVSKSPTGREGVRLIPFVVRNGPAIETEGLKENDVVDGIIPLMVNAYDKGNQQRFIIEGSETPQSIPSWVWALVLMFFAWAIFYTITNLSL